jgi:hypothetical protein
MYSERNGHGEARDEDDGFDWVAISEGLEVEDMETMHEDCARSSIKD